ncbi:MAG: LysM peptidoglycan-binding domain-containing protein [Bacteroidales bacterium]|nr:LysM peptidoglycan-binding domain-containing protein [Bacteroidales bacterium]
MKKHSAFLLMLSMFFLVVAQGSITKSKIKQKLNGKEYYVHIVEHGQTVFSVSRAYGVKYYDAFIKKDMNKLQIGDTIWIPVSGAEPPSNESYRYVEVKQGQTLYNLSKTYKVSIDDIERLNPELKGSQLKVGMILKMPLEGSEAGKDNSSSKNNTGTGTSVTTSNTSESIVPFQFSIRDRIDKNKIHVTLMMPLFLDNIGEISTSKFDIEQRRRRTYKSFTFIQFYEGILMGLDYLESQGYNVVLNVVDIPDDDPAKVTKAFEEYDIANSDFIIAMLFQHSFEKAAALAKENKVFIINPISDRDEILKDNPYVIKYMPSIEGSVKSILNVVKKNFKNPHLYLIHSNSQLEKQWFEEFKKQLSEQKEIAYTLFSWSASNRLLQMLKNDNANVVVSIYDEAPGKNKTYSNVLLNKLFSLKKTTPTLFTTQNYIKIYNDVDYNQLQRLDYHLFNNTYLDYANPMHKDFIETFKEKFKTEPIGDYALIGNDVIIHFVLGLHKRGSEFWKAPNIPLNSNILYPMSFKRSNANDGFENQAAYIYKMQDYKLVPANKKQY